MDKKQKKLKLMRFWLIGASLLLFLGFSLYLYIITKAMGAADYLSAVMNLWPVWLITIVVCVVIYYFYSWIVNRKMKPTKNRK